MCFYREDKLLAKRAFSKYVRPQTPEEPQRAFNSQQEETKFEAKDFLNAKKQTLEEQITGIYDHPVALGQNHTSTEGESEKSDSGIESPSSIVANYQNQIINENITNLLLANQVYKKIRLDQAAPINMLRMAPVEVEVKSFQPSLLDNRITNDIFRMINTNMMMINQIAQSQEEAGIKMLGCVRNLKKYQF